MELNFSLPSIILFLKSSTVFWLLLTLLGFQLGVWLYEKTGNNSLVLPIVTAIAVVVLSLTLLEHSYVVYFEQVQLIHVLLGPATVALAVPLYRQLGLVRKLFLPILFTLVVCSVLTIGSAVLIADSFGASERSLLSLMTKSITTPIALEVSDIIGGYPSLAAGIVILTGVFAVVIGVPLLRWLGVDHPAAQGLAMGFSGHAIGTARALQISPQAGGFSALGMGLMGISTALVLPLLARYLV